LRGVKLPPNSNINPFLHTATPAKDSLQSFKIIARELKCSNKTAEKKQKAIESQTLPARISDIIDSLTISFQRICVFPDLSSTLPHNHTIFRNSHLV
jgi:hypothetical protein